MGRVLDSDIGYKIEITYKLSEDKRGRVLDSDIRYKIEITYTLSENNGGESVRLGYSVRNRNHVQAERGQRWGVLDSDIL